MKVHDAERPEQNVRAVGQMYDCRRAAKFILGARYGETIDQWRLIISKQMRQSGDSVLQAALHLGEKSSPSADGTVLMFIMAAAVEMIEEPASSV
jgi:hypothetical protein